MNEFKFRIDETEELDECIKMVAIESLDGSAYLKGYYVEMVGMDYDNYEVSTSIMSTGIGYEYAIDSSGCLLADELVSILFDEYDTYAYDYNLFSLSSFMLMRQVEVEAWQKPCYLIYQSNVKNMAWNYQ